MLGKLFKGRGGAVKANGGPDATRSGSGYADAVITAILARAAGGPAETSTTAGVVAAASAVARAFAGADVVGDGAPMLSPAVLFTTGYRLIVGGEAVFLIDGGKLYPAVTWDIAGTYDPATWRYEIQLAGPSREKTKMTVPGDEVVHVALSTDGRTWRGQSPVPALTAGLLAETELALLDEAKGPRGHLVPYPTDAASAVQELTDQISTLRGRLAMVKSTRSASVGFNSAPARDWDPMRIGFAAPEELVMLREAAEHAVIAAAGHPPAFQSMSDGTSQRESYRRWAHATLQPLARLCEAEWAKIGGARLTFGSLMAGDITGRARAFKALTEAGMSKEQAAKLTGLEGS